MKNLTQRSKILLGIVAVVVVIVAAGLIYLGPSLGLYGGDVIHISPTNPTINVGQTLDLSINSLFGCNWYSSSIEVAPFITDGGAGYANWYGDDEHHYKKVQIIAKKPGQEVITAECAMTRRTTVTVK